MPRRALSPKRSARSQSADQLDFYPPLNPTGVSVKGQVQSKPKDKESPGSLSRRNSAPLLRSESKKGNKPKRIDTSTYLRPGITPAHGKSSPARQMSTFGPVYIPPWETSRPSTAPLANDSILSGDEADELLGGVHYSTYGARDDDTLMSYDGPFSDASVPVPEELFTQAELNEIARAEQEAAKLKHKRSRSGSGLLRMVVGDDDKDIQPRSRKGTLTSIVLPQSLTSSSSSRPGPSSQSYVTIGTGTEQSHGTTSQEDTTLISMSKFPMPPAESVPPTPATAQPGTPGTPVFGARPTTPGFTGARPTTPGSMTTIQQGRTTPGPMTPAVPDFLINSRADADSEPEPEPRRLRTKSSLLALAKSFTGADSGSSTPKSDPRGANTPLTEHGSSTPGSSTPQPRPIASRTDSSNPRRRSMLERLAARLAGPSAQDETWVDESFTSDLDSDNERALRDQRVSPVLDFDLPEEPLIDLEQFGMIIGSSSPVRAQASATFPPMQGPPAFFPTEPRNRTLSKLSTTGRKVLNKVDGGRRRTVSVFSAGSRKSRKHTRGMSRESANQRRMSRESAIQRRASADMLSAEGSIEGTVMYGVGEEMLRLMFGGALEEQPERERTRSLPRRVSGPKRAASSPKALGSPKRATMTRKQSKNQRATHEAEGENHHAGDAGSLDLKFSPPNPMVIPAIPRRKGHRRTGSNSASKENVSVRPLSVRAKSPVERVKSPVERAKSPVSVRAKSPVEIRPALKSRSRSKSAPLGFVEFDPKPAGILTNGRSTPNSARVVIVNSATTPNLPPSTPRRQITRSTPLTPPTPEDNTLTQPGVVVTAPTPPAPRRSSSMPLDGLSGSGDSPRDSVEPQRATMSRGTSVQFVPESYENPRRSGRSRREAPSNASSSGPPVLELSGTVSGNGKGKRKVDREVSDAPDASMSNPSKKPKLSEEEIDITFMGEPLFGGHPQRRGGLGSIDRASSHHSSYSRHSQSYSRHSQSYSRHSQSFHRPAPNPYPSPTSSPEPERGTIPIHAILTPRVQSLYGTGSIYDSRRQSISSIPRPKSRASARSNATGRRSNMTGARSARSNRTGVSGKSGPRPLKDRLPMQGWCFLIGFFFPFAWWYAAFARAERGYYGGGVWSSEVESQWEGVRTDVHRDDGRIDAHTWRFRCRLMAAVSIVVDERVNPIARRPRGSATDFTSTTRSHSPLAVPELADESLTLCRPLMFMSIPGSYQHNRPGDLEKLPQELVVRVLEHCGFRTILLFSETCRAYHALVAHSSRLQLKIELGANGLQIPRRYLTDDGLRSRELLKQIVRRRDSWLDLRLNPGHSLPRTTSGQRFTLWELRDGIFASAFFTGEFRPLEANAIKMIVLDPPILDWTLSFDFTFHELTIDPVQDLLVLAAADDANSHSLTLRFRSLKTGVAHPSAKQGIIPIPLDYSVHPHPIYSTVSLVVTDEMLLVSLIAHDAKLPYDILVWDWHAGVLLTRTDRRMGLCGATFLDHSRFIVYEGLFSSPGEPDTPISDSLNLLIYDIPPARPSTNSAHATSETPPSEPILQFEFPQFGHSTWILNADFLLRTAPIPSSTPCTPELLFDPSCRILSLSMRLSMNDASVSFLVFVDSSQIFTHLARAQLEGRTYIPWKEWGEHSTRWIRYNSDPNPWINWLHGTKYVLGRQVIDEQPEIQDNPYLAVADFHSLTIKRSKSRQLSNYVSSHEQDGVTASRLEAIRDGKWAFLDCYHEGAKLVEGQLAVDIVDSDTPTVITDFGPIPIVSRLPYRLAVSRPSQSVKGCSDWMIDNNRIIGIGPNPDTGLFGDLITIQSIEE